jgi:NAD dependent epimerase/dehydratase
MNWNRKRVLVTGAAGFIGSHLVEELVKKGARVRALARYNSRNDWGMLEVLPKQIKQSVEVVTGDVCDYDRICNLIKGCDYVFHLAALIPIPYSYLAPTSFFETNTLGTVNVLNACRDSVERMVHTSTSETYGTAEYVPIDEKHPLKAQSPYAASKIGADKAVESFHRSFGMPVVTVRPFNTYGPRQSARAVVPTIISQALAKNEVALGSLKPVRDFNYVMDTVSGFILAAESEHAVGEVINIGSGKGHTIGEVVENVGQLCGGKLKIARDRRRVRKNTSEVMELVCDNSKARELLGWKPKFSLNRGLKNTINYISRNPGLFKTDIYNV